MKYLSTRWLALCVSLAVPIIPATTKCTARTVEYDLTISEEAVDFTGKSRRALTINGSIPGPTLSFTQGDHALIRVHNQLDEDASMHWHGLLLPNAMDGVPYVTYPPIKPGTTFTYEFPIRQSGTYWYHSHTGTQEQRGLYGSIVIQPGTPRFQPDQDRVILLSDWTDENPHEVLRTLKRGSEWFAIRKKSAQSVLGAARLGMAGDFFKRELQRMPPMDISDVYYDRFLANGMADSQLAAKPGETVRLRIIDGSATTFFFVEFAGGPMTIVAADGVDVEPFEEDRFLIGVAETYDVLVRVPEHGAYEFRATAHDGSGHASVWIGEGQHHPAPDVPQPNLYHTMGSFSPRQIIAFTPAGAMDMGDRAVQAGKFDQPGMMGMSGKGGMSEMSETTGMDMDHQEMTGGMDHAPMAGMDVAQETAMPSETAHPEHEMASPRGSDGALAVDGMDPRRPWPIYGRLRALGPTNFPKDKPVREIRLTLDGDMERYVWFLNNKPLSESDSIEIRRGEIVRFIMINRTMMHHPMHLHGHFFRVVNGQGDYAPLKHTVDVTPMSTTVIEFKADEFGDWFFHCHLLYHMKAGMARVVHYDEFEPAPDVAAVRSELYKDDWWFWAEGAGLSQMTDGIAVLSDTRNILSVTWEIGWERVDETDYEIDVTWDRSFNRFFSVFAGAQLTNTEGADNRGIFGLRYLLPLSFTSSTWVDSDGDFRFAVAKSVPLTSRLIAFGDVEYDTNTKWEWVAGAEFIVSKRVSVVGQYHSEFGGGAGLAIRF